MTQTTARLSRQGKHFEILVDLEEALRVKKDVGNVNAAVVTDKVFYNLKSGEVASSEDLMKNFGTTDFFAICEKIIKSGMMEMPEQFVRKEMEQKYKQVVDFLTKNAVSPEGRPYTPERIQKALEEAHVNVKNKPVADQVQDIIEQLKIVLPLKIEMKRLRITIPAQYTGRGYGILHEYLEKEEWLSNGDLQATLKMPAALVFDFYDKLNGVTHGSAFSEEIKEK
jgi:ribosome maturation protein SDO1